MIEENRVLLDETVISGTKPFVIVGIPAFDEEQTIAGVVLMAQKFADIVVVCDDGSKDSTGKIAENFGAQVIRHKQNLGYGAAIKDLFRRALDLGADVLVTLDGDGQHFPEEIPNVVEPILQNDADMVIGSRFVDSRGAVEMPLYRRAGVKLITGIVNGSSKNHVSDAQSGFRAYNRKALERLSVLEAGMGASVQILMDAGKQNLKILEVPASCKYNNHEVATSTKNPLAHGMDIMMSVIRLVAKEKSLLFLRISGMISLLAGLAFGVYILQTYVLQQRIAMNIALASTILMLIGFYLLLTRSGHHTYI